MTTSCVWTTPAVVDQCPSLERRSVGGESDKSRCVESKSVSRKFVRSEYGGEAILSAIPTQVPFVDLSTCVRELI